MNKWHKNNGDQESVCDASQCHHISQPERTVQAGGDTLTMRKS